MVQMELEPLVHWEVVTVHQMVGALACWWAGTHGISLRASGVGVASDCVQGDVLGGQWAGRV